MKKDLKKFNVTVADTTGAIPFSVWEDQIEEIEVSKCYTLTKVRVSYFNETYLNATPSTTIAPLAEGEEVELSEQSSKDLERLKYRDSHVFAGTILAAETTKNVICINCKNRKLPLCSSSSIVTCSNCHASMLAKNLEVQVASNLMVRDGTSSRTEKFYCPMNVLQAFLRSAKLPDAHMKDDLSKIAAEKVTATLLNIGQLMFDVSMDKKTINSMK